MLFACIVVQLNTEFIYFMSSQTHVVEMKRNSGKKTNNQGLPDIETLRVSIIYIYISMTKPVNTYLYYERCVKVRRQHAGDDAW